MEKIRIATANRGAGTAPVFATVEGGSFRNEGLEDEGLFRELLGVTPPEVTA